MNYDKTSFLAGLRTGLALGRRVFVSLISKLIRANGVYRAENDGAAGYSVVTVDVPNSYTAADEGKVVSSGALAAQTALTVTVNGIYDTTENNRVTVNVSGGASVLSGAEEPSAMLGSDGQIYLWYLDASWLPAGATALKSLSSVGGNRNNGFFGDAVFKPTTEIQMDCVVASTVYANWQGLVGVRNSAPVYMLYSRCNGYADFGVEANASMSGVPLTRNTAIYDKRIRIRLNASGVTYTDGINTYSINVNPPLPTTGNIYFLGTDYSGAGAAEAPQCQVFAIRVFENSTLVNDYRPIKNAENTVCFYDVVTATYKYPVSGTWTAGEIINDGEILTAYLKKNGAWQPLIGSNIGDVG